MPTRGFSLVLLLMMGAVLSPTLRASELFSADQFPGVWAITTNENGTVCATESAIHRLGRVVYSRVLILRAVPAEGSARYSGTATPEEIRHFIASYRPPATPYTSERAARQTGREKFNCLEFAKDLVNQANNHGVPAQVIGILFKGQWSGHAVAGFPASDGQTLYFDSTPGAGQISHEAREARVVVGETYSRAGGGELSRVGHAPISEIIPVTKLPNLADSFGSKANPETEPGSMVWMVSSIKRVPAEGIDYADTNSLGISNDQLARWDAAASAVKRAESEMVAAQTQATRNLAARTSARALAENQAQAARNDPYGQLRMGERYLTGDGVPKNPALGRAYLKQAADQGYPSALEELKRLEINAPGNSR